MRDPNRIPRIVEKLRALWLAHPDLRLGQIVVNATPSGLDTFYAEDDKIEEGIDALLAAEPGRELAE